MFLFAFNLHEKEFDASLLLAKMSYNKSLS